MAWVYIVECNDGTLYVGSTRDLESRIELHNRGRGARYTAQRLPVRLVWAEEFERVDEAWAAERRLHGWSAGKKRALIAGDMAQLRSLARSSYRRRGDV